jgi:hypothetical protein
MDSEATAGAVSSAELPEDLSGELYAAAPEDATAGEASEPSPAGRSGGDGNNFRLADRYVISPGTALPEFDSPRARAVAATDTRGGARPLLALIAPRHLGLREEVLGAARRIERAHVMRVAEWGVIDWPSPDGARQRQPVVIIERPGGSRLMPRGDGHIDPLSEDALVRRVLRPLTNALRDIHGAGITHRGVRPDNLFWRDGGGAEAVLGEGWVAPPASEQPVLFETIGSGMALPAARGPGKPADDLYALGATLAVLLSGVNPVARLDDHAIIETKIGQGSFITLAGNLRLSTPLAEVLRGLLADDQDERWTLEDLELWFDGRRLSPKAPNLPTQAARPLTFGDTNYLTRQGLAHGLVPRWAQAIPFVAEVGLGVWLKRSLGEEKRSVLANQALSGGGESGRSGADHQLARVLMILDPTAPIRYREIAVHVDGLGALLAESLDKGPVMQQIAQVVAQKLPPIWVELQEDPRAENGQVRKANDMMNYFLGKTTPGFGIERCLYESNPGLPCRSPLIDADYVTRLQDLLFYLDRAAERSEPTVNLLDRHVAAFIGARLGSAADTDLTRFGTAQELSERCVALLRVFAMVQAVAVLHELPHLGDWIAQQLKPLVDSFHHRPFKEALAKEIGPLCYRGDFAGLVRVVENDSLRQRDASGFEAARRRYAAVREEADWIRGGGLTATRRVIELAHQTAAIASGSVAAVASGAVMVYLMG